MILACSQHLYIDVCDCVYAGLLVCKHKCVYSMCPHVHLYFGMCANVCIYVCVYSVLPRKKLRDMGFCVQACMQVL